jgi:hypothetical protein
MPARGRAYDNVVMALRRCGGGAPARPVRALVRDWSPRFMAHRSDQPVHPTRRTVAAAGSTLLAGFALDAVFPAAGFAVDKVASAGVRGTGWRAAGGDPQWITVDLQAVSQVTSIRLTFEAAAGDPVFVKPASGNWADGTTGRELLSSYAVAFEIDVSTDDRTWTSIYQTTSGTGGTVQIDLPAPVTARWLCLTATRRSDASPLGLNGFEVYGTAPGRRPDATGWTDWGAHDHRPPALETAADGTVPPETGWVLTMDDWAPGDGAALSQPTVDTSTWLPATVPGTVLASLVEQGHLPDPGSQA